MYEGDDEQVKSNNSIRNTSDAFLDAYTSDEVHRANVESIKNRKGVNEAHPKYDDDDLIEEKTSSRKSSLEEKEGLEEKEKLEKETLKDVKEDKSITKSVNAKEKLEDLSGITKLKKKWLKLKIEVQIGLVVAGIILSFLLFVILYVSIASAIDTFTSAITNFFGISEGTIKEGNDTFRTGLYTEKAYQFDEDGNEISSEDLIYKLRDDGDGCRVTILTRIGDFLSGQDVKTRCQFMRYIKRKSEEQELDRSLIIGTILYGYDTEPFKTEYYDEKDIPKDYITTAEHYQVLERILSNEDYPITKTMLDKIIDNTIATEIRYYYTWSIKEETNEDGEIVSKTGVCKREEQVKKEYDLDKWKIFMRFGEDAAKAYEKYNKIIFDFGLTSEECTGRIKKDKLLERVRNSGGGVDNLSSDIEYGLDVDGAISAYQNYVPTYSDLFYQHADTDSRELDTFESYKEVEFDYANGFAYQNFPGYGKAMNDNLTSVKYDKVFTPKDIEMLVEDIIDKKQYMNEVLLLNDPDNPNTFAFADRSSSITTGAYCSNYLTAPLDSIKVRLTDCYGKELDRVTFEDYIIGVANAEVSNTHDNYVLSEMVAAISYALNRRSNYSKGDLITMKSGTCDQAYCSPIKGCQMVNNPDICSGCASFYIGGSRGKNPDLYAKYRLLYQTAAQYLVVSNGKVHNAHYVSTIQNQWKAKALSGLYFTQIIQETYQDEGAEVIRCTDGETENQEEKQPSQSTEKYGNIATEDYPKKAPDKGSYYGFAYANTDNGKQINIIPAWKEYNLTTIKPSCSDNTFATMSFTVNAKSVDKFQKAFDGVCKLLTTGVKISNGDTCKYTMSDLQGGTAFLESKTELGDLDLHPYGLSQSWNYSKVFNINGKSYTPYSPAKSAEEYWAFVNAIGGKEEDCKNINYILWLKAYKSAGFSWGGNNGRKGYDGSFRGNEFEIIYK